MLRNFGKKTFCQKIFRSKKIWSWADILKFGPKKILVLKVVIQKDIGSKNVLFQKGMVKKCLAQENLDPIKWVQKIWSKSGQQQLRYT